MNILNLILVCVVLGIMSLSDFDVVEAGEKGRNLKQFRARKGHCGAKGRRDKQRCRKKKNPPAEPSASHSSISSSSPTCSNKRGDCEKLASSGECMINPGWMLENCQKACVCDNIDLLCSENRNKDHDCDHDAGRGEC